MDPSSLWGGLRRRASARSIRVLLVEPEDPRVQSAAAYLEEQGIARPVRVGTPPPGATGEWVDPATHPRREEFWKRLFERRKAKGMSEAQAQELLRDPLYFGVMALQAGLADALVGGAVRTTADTVRAGFAGLGLGPEADVAFGAFLLDCPHATGGPRPIVFADGAVSPHPSPRALAAVGVASADLFRRWTGREPRVAYLSFSTRRSAEDESVSAVRQAVERVRKMKPGLAVDGELQGDAALVDHIAQQKGAADGDVAGRANVLVFPDLNAGNIAYKLVQHLGGARAVGPVVAGLAKPFSDLSRGCTDEDIVDAVALTALL